MTTPDLAIAASYSRDDFGDLLRTGTARGNRELTVMSAVSERFSHFSDSELDALHAYFVARATRRPQPDQ
jgi:hypothetical protein